jgi:Cdc6-like AAA superfamily ATPase
MNTDEKLRIIAATLSPERPIRSSEFLRGRLTDLERIERELRYFHAVPFIYGHRGVGKTSLARTAAQLVTPADREHVYVACAPGSRSLQIFREIGEELLKLAIRLCDTRMLLQRVDIELSLSPAIKASFERRTPKLEPLDNVTSAVRLLRELDQLLPAAENTVVVLDELESLNDQDRGELAYFIKQLGDQEFRLKFILVGIAANVHELIGAHESVPRYLKEVSLQPLPFQVLMDIVERAASDVGVVVPRSVLIRIAIIGNGFPHFAHLMGKSLLIETVLANADSVSDDIYQLGVASAVKDSLEELRISYETATQRSEDYYKHLIWALAHSDVVDVRIDEWLRLYFELASRNHWQAADETRLRTAIGNFASESYGKIIVNTPARYGSVETRYRYKRFANTLMRGHVRLNAENEGARLGHETGL